MLRLTYASTSKSVLSNNMDDWIEAIIDTNINITKDGWFAYPTQVFNHGQWWSIFNTQRLPKIKFYWLTKHKLIKTLKINTLVTMMNTGSFISITYIAKLQILLVFFKFLRYYSEKCFLLSNRFLKCRCIKIYRFPFER